MTTFTFSGTRVTYSDGNATAVKTVEASIVVPSSSAHFSYSITGRGEHNTAFIEMEDTVRQVTIDGDPLHEPGHGNPTGAGSHDGDGGHHGDGVHEGDGGHHGGSGHEGDGGHHGDGHHGDDGHEGDTMIASVTWAGGTSVVLAFTEHSGSGGETQYFFVLDGPALPKFNSVEKWNAFESSIEEFATPTGSFGPGASIPWSSIPGVKISQKDEVAGTAENDRIHTGAGRDEIVSSDGNDFYNGGKGWDQVSFEDDPAGVFVSLKSGKATDGWGNTDTLMKIEMLRGSSHEDTLGGNGGRNIFRGMEGEDVIDGLGGRDEVRYDLDSRSGGRSGVEVNLSKGYAIDGFGDRDTLKHIEDVRGSAHRDKIAGTGGANKLDGKGSNDWLFGRGGSDALLGGAGRDRLFGGTGDDTLNGGAGDDRILGGAGDDTFIFKGRFGDDMIRGFEALNDDEQINLRGVKSITSLKDLRNNHMEQDGSDVVIDDGKGNSITLLDVHMSDLGASDFIF